MINSASDEGMHKDHSSVMGKGAHNNTQLTELVVAASRCQIDMLRKIEWGKVSASIGKSTLANCLRPPSQINWVLDGFRSRRLEAIHLERASMAEHISPTEATASAALQWMYACNHNRATQTQFKNLGFIGFLKSKKPEKWEF